MAEEQKPPTSPEPAHQPGTGKGEEKVQTEGREPGRQDTGTQGANRPTGKTTGQESSGVTPSNPVDPQSPHLPTP
jgi:hypothetical protein